MGFVLCEFGKIPVLPEPYSHQSNSVTVTRYFVPEGTHVAPGTPLVAFENWWARFELLSTAHARVAKNLYDSIPGIRVDEGSEVVFLMLDADDLPANGSLFDLRHVVDIRLKPSKSNAG